MRFRVLETLREFAIEQLVANIEVAGTHTRHAQYFLDLALEIDGRDRVRSVDG